MVEPITRLFSILNPFSRTKKAETAFTHLKVLFIVWADYNNFAYLRGAKHLNFWEGKWALFLGWFSFTLTYHPGSKYVKPDALSLQFLAVSEPILPPACVVGMLVWQVEEPVYEALRSSVDTGKAL